MALPQWNRTEDDPEIDKRTSMNNRLKSNSYNLISTSVEETVAIGYNIGGVLKAGDIVALIGDLGAGKTWLCKGIAQGLGVDKSIEVTSPAFDIIHEYKGNVPVYHMDFYRLNALSDEDYLWLDEYFSSGKGVCLIEWANRIEIAQDWIKINLAYKDHGKSREIRIEQNKYDEEFWKFIPV